MQNMNGFPNQGQFPQNPMQNFQFIPQIPQYQFPMPQPNFGFTYYDPYKPQTTTTTTTTINNVPQQQPQIQMIPTPFPMNPMIPQFMPAQFVHPMFLANQNKMMMQQQNQFHPINNSQNQELKQTVTVKRKAPEYDESRPENSKEEILKWIAARKRNYPSKANIERKEREKKEREEAGEVVEPTLSVLEQKLRKKIQILSKLESKQNKKKEYEKRYLLYSVLNPFKKEKEEHSDDEETIKKKRLQNSDTKEADNAKESESIEPQGQISEEKSEKTATKVDEIFEEFQRQIQKIEKKEAESDEPEMQPIFSEKKLLKIKEDENKQAADEQPKTVKRVTFEEKKKVSSSDKSKIRSKRQEADESKMQTPQEIIEKLKKKREEEEEELSKFLEGKRSGDYKYKTDTLLARMLVDSVYKERNVILQAIRYIVKENFFDPKEESNQEINTGTSNIQQE